MSFRFYYFAYPPRYSMGYEANFPMSEATGEGSSHRSSEQSLHPVPEYFHLTTDSKPPTSIDPTNNELLPEKAPVER